MQEHWHTETSKREVVVSCVKSQAHWASVCNSFPWQHTQAQCEARCAAAFSSQHFCKWVWGRISEPFFGHAAAPECMHHKCTGKGVLSRFWLGRWLRHCLVPFGAGRRNLQLWERRGQIGVVFERRIEALRLHRAKCRGSAQLVQKEISARWVSQSWVLIHEGDADHQWNARGYAVRRRAIRQNRATSMWVKLSGRSLILWDVEDA